MKHTAEKDAGRAPCGHTTRPCTDSRKWCPGCDATPCCHHAAGCTYARPIPPATGDQSEDGAA